MTGLLRLGVIPTIAPFLLPQSLRLLRGRYPELRLALREDLTANLLLRLEDGQLDFALIALPYDTANLLVEPLFDDDLWIVGRKGDPEIKARKVNVTPSISDRLLLLEEGHCLRDHALYACGVSIRRPSEGVEHQSLDLGADGRVRARHRTGPGNGGEKWIDGESQPDCATNG